MILSYIYTYLDGVINYLIAEGHHPVYLETHQSWGIDLRE
jgi:hypothetical protein